METLLKLDKRKNKQVSLQFERAKFKINYGTKLNREHF